MKRLRIGVSIPIAVNAGVLAKDVAATDSVRAIALVSALNYFGWYDGKVIGKVFGMPLTMVLTLS